MRAHQFITEGNNFQQVHAETAARAAKLKAGIETLAKEGLLNKIYHPQAGIVYMISNDLRPIVLVNYNGIQIPFYMSTGMGGKADYVPVDKWYPFFGIGPKKGWINKSGSRMASYYGSPVLKSIAERLDAVFGDCAMDIYAPQLKPPMKNDPSIIRQINKGLSPGDGGDEQTANNINSLLQKIESSASSTQSASQATPSNSASGAAVVGPLTLTINGVKMGPYNISGSMGRDSLKRYGDDYIFWDIHQFKLELNRADNTWTLIPNTAAKNKTMINGVAVTAPTKIHRGMRIAAGNPEKKIEKLPMIVA